MTRQQKNLFVLRAALLSTTILSVAVTPRDYAAPADSPAASSPAIAQRKRKPTLAVTVASQEAGGCDCGIVDDLLAVEMSNQSVLQIVDRQRMQAVLKEHAVALGNLNDTKSAITLGKFAGADYLLHVLAEKKTAAIRLVEVATGQVKLEEQVALREDLTLSAAAIREKVLAALRPESQAANRLTVGIAAFPNRSGTDRSDKLGIELQKVLRKRLQERPWAVVLERQYPTALLEEVDLARAGLVRGNAVEKLPPADLVILGTMEDVGREYEPGKPWEVKLDLTLRLRDQSSQISRKCRSDAIEAAADEIMGKIDEFRRRPASPHAVPEKELWRRQALYLMPRPMLSGYKNAIIPEFYGWWLNDIGHVEVIRAWENVLLLDDKDAEAMTYLGVCGIGFSRWFYNDTGLSGEKRNAKSAQWIAASRLLERALKIQPTTERAATYLYCLRPMVDAVPTRAREMAQYVQDHPEQFKGLPESPWVKVALTKSLATTNDDRYVQLDRVLSNGANDPNAVLISLPQGPTRSKPIQRYSELLNKYKDSSDPVVQFAVHRALGEWRFTLKRDPACLEHFDRAIAVMEAAYAKCKSPHRDSLNNIYRLKIEACLFFKRPEEAKKTAWAGARHFMEVGRFDSSEHFTATSSWYYENHIGWLYQYCVTEAREDGREKQELSVCDAYLALAKPVWMLSAPWPRISARREELLVRLAGKRVPDMRDLRAVEGAKWNDATWISMTAAAGKLWFVPGSWQSLYSYDGNRVAQILNTHSNSGVAIAKDAVFRGSSNGLLKLDAGGNLLKHYGMNDPSFPGNDIGGVCEGDGKVYFSFHGSPRNGIAVLDPATDRVTVLAPSNREATQETEPVGDRGGVSWDSASRQLFVQTHFHRSYGSPILTSVYCWSAKDESWRRLPLNEAPQFVVSDGNETLLTRIVGDQTEFHFEKSGQKLTVAVPVPTLLGKPAWDEDHIWAPTASGLYEIDRATGKMTWLAYEDGNFFRSVLKTDGRLYVATSRGLYYRDLSSAPTAVRSVAPEVASITLPVDISLEENPNAKDAPNAKAEVTVQLDHGQTLQKTSPGNAKIDLSLAGNGVHHIFFHCPGYASQWVYVEIAGGKTSLTQAKVKLFRNRYVILRCAFNTNGERGLEGDDVEEQRVALSHWTNVKPFGQDWQIWQKSSSGGMFGDIPYLEFHRISDKFGFAKPTPGVSYEQMKEAPKSGYRCEDIKAKKGLVLYCHLNGNNKGGIGYGKILVEAITEKPPADVRVVARLEF